MFIIFGKSKRYLVNYNLGHTFSELNATITSYTEYESIFGKNRFDSRKKIENNFLNHLSTIKI